MTPLMHFAVTPLLQRNVAIHFWKFNPPFSLILHYDGWARLMDIGKVKNDCEDN